MCMGLVDLLAPLAFPSMVLGSWLYRCSCACVWDPISNLKDKQSVIYANLAMEFYPRRILYYFISLRHFRISRLHAAVPFCLHTNCYCLENMEGYYYRQVWCFWLQCWWRRWLGPKYLQACHTPIRYFLLMVLCDLTISAFAALEKA